MFRGNTRCCWGAGVRKLSGGRVFCDVRVFVAVEDGSRIFLGIFEFCKDEFAHVQSGFKGCLFGAVLFVGEIASELVPLAGDAQSPALKGGCLIGIASDVTLCHGIMFVVMGEYGRRD